MVVRAHRFTQRIDQGLDPLRTACRLGRSGMCDTYAVYERNGVWSFFGGVHSRLTLHPGTLTVQWADREPERHAVTGPPLRQVASALRNSPYEGWRAYGWASFELAYALYGQSALLGATVGDETLLDIAFPLIEVSLRTDGAVISSSSRALLTQCADLIGEPIAESDCWPKEVDVSALDHEYHRIVTDAVEELSSRRLSKVILSRTVTIDFDIDLVATYLLGRQENTPARSFLISFGGIEAAGFSPETVVEVNPTGRVSTQPLAGTRALTGADAENVRLRRALLRDPKEIFEHAISVKVAYDELRQLCGDGQVWVEDFMEVRERGSVQHLASRVSGQLPGDRDAWDALAALFPAVTASGSPKPAALDAIHRYESDPRGLYSGAVFTVDSAGAMDAALVLRAVYRRAGRAWLRAGAGIVEQSTPEREHEETCEKLRSVAQHLVPAAAVGSFAGLVERSGCLDSEGQPT